MPLRALYRFTGAIGSSFWPYYARMHGPWHVSAGGTVDLPVGYFAFAKEISRPPRSVAGVQLYSVPQGHPSRSPAA